MCTLNSSKDQCDHCLGCLVPYRCSNRYLIIDWLTELVNPCMPQFLWEFRYVTELSETRGMEGVFRNSLF